MRASDADRDKVADELRIHCVEGRITLDELDIRLEGVMGSKTIRELAECVYDLPTITVAPPAGRVQPTPRIGPPGSLPFTRRVLVPAPLARTRDVALDTIAPALNGFGYELVSHSSAGLVFERRHRPGPGIVAAILFFPLGLLALLRSSKRERIVISLDKRGSASTTMTIHGVASRRVRKAFAQLTFS